MSFFVPSLKHFSLFNYLIDDEAIRDFKQHLLASCDNNTLHCTQLYEQPLFEVLELIDLWYENEMLKAGKEIEDSNNKGMSGNDLLQMGLGLTPEDLLEGLDDG